ncbi:hypothetical protein HK097_006731, partial [Rhizophlyctis rosea]
QQQQQSPSFDFTQSLLLQTRTLLTQTLSTPPAPTQKDTIPDTIISLVKYSLSLHTYLTSQDSTTYDIPSHQQPHQDSSSSARTKAKRKALDEYRVAAEDLARRTRDYVATLARMEEVEREGAVAGTRRLSQHNVVVDVMEATDVLMMRLAQIREIYDGKGRK